MGLQTFNLQTSHFNRFGFLLTFDRFRAHQRFFIAYHFRVIWFICDIKFFFFNSSQLVLVYALPLGDEQNALKCSLGFEIWIDWNIPVKCNSFIACIKCILIGTLFEISYIIPYHVPDIIVMYLIPLPTLNYV